MFLLASMAFAAQGDFPGLLEASENIKEMLVYILLTTKEIFIFLFDKKNKLTFVYIHILFFITILVSQITFPIRTSRMECTLSK